MQPRYFAFYDNIRYSINLKLLLLLSFVFAVTSFFLS